MDDVKMNFSESEVISDNLSGVLISEDAAESLVRCFLPDIVSFFESENGRKEFEEWDKCRPDFHDDSANIGESHTENSFYLCG